MRSRQTRRRHPIHHRLPRQLKTNKRPRLVKDWSFRRYPNPIPRSPFVQVSW